MRVLTVGNMYPPHHLGGYELAWQRANDVLRDRGHEVHVLTTDHREPDAGQGDEAHVRRELRWYWSDHDFPRLGLRGRLALERHNARVLARAVADARPDVAVFWSMGGMSLSLIARAASAGLRCIGVVHDDWLVYGPLVDQWERARRRLRLGPGFRPGVVEAWLFNSDFTRRRALEHVALRATDVAYPGIDLELMKPAPEHDWRWRLACVGRIDPRKGIATAIRALAELPAEARLDVVGGGDEAHRHELESLADELGVTVAFSVRPHDELPAVYGAADAVLFPVEWDEPFGLVPLEAMAVGTPVVATGTGGSAEYLRDERNCILVPRGEAPGALADALRRLAGDPGLRARLRAGGLETAPRFPAQALGEALEAVCLSGAPGRSP